MYQYIQSTHNDIVTKLGGDIVSRLDRRLASFLFSLINHNNIVVKYITKVTLSCPRLTLAENYKHLLYKHTFSYLDCYSDIGTIHSKIPLATDKHPEADVRADLNDSKLNNKDR